MTLDKAIDQAQAISLDLGVYHCEFTDDEDESTARWLAGLMADMDQLQDTLKELKHCASIPEASSTRRNTQDA